MLGSVSGAILARDLLVAWFVVYVCDGQKQSLNRLREDGERLERMTATLRQKMAEVARLQHNSAGVPSLLAGLVHPHTSCRRVLVQATWVFVVVVVVVFCCALFLFVLLLFGGGHMPIACVRWSIVNVCVSGD